VYELLRDVAHAEREQFHVVLLDLCVALGYVELAAARPENAAPFSLSPQHKWLFRRLVVQQHR
jgi:hypothetical protein